MKFALISHVFPPSPSGQSVVISRLLKEMNPDDYCIISRQMEEVSEAQNGTGSLQGKRYYLPPEYVLTRGYKYGLSPLRQNFNILFGILTRSRRIADISRRERCNAIVACTGDLLDMPAAYLAARRLHIPFYAYIFDHYSYREWLDPKYQFWAKRLEPILLKNADGVIAVNEVLSNDLLRHYGVTATVIHNPLNLSEYEEANRIRPIEEQSEIRILYTGAIYEAHFDAFRNLLRAIDILGRPDIKLHVYTVQSSAQMAKEGIVGPVVFHPHIAPSAVPAVQSQADMLFLPLAFNSPYPDLVRTSATTKLGEYLAARRPILAHVPPDSFVAWYLREYKCGIVLDRNEPATVAEAIEQILNNHELQQQFCERAWERAQYDFEISSARIKFRELIDGGLSPVNAL